MVTKIYFDVAALSHKKKLDDTEPLDKTYPDGTVTSNKKYPEDIN